LGKQKQLSIRPATLPTTEIPVKGVNPTTEGVAPSPDFSHEWVVNAQLRITAKIAKNAAFRGSFRVPEQTRVEALDVICEKCRRDYHDVAADDDCAAKIDNTHLIGGDRRERAKRKPRTVHPGVIVVPAPRVDRRGINAVLSRQA